MNLVNFRSIIRLTDSCALVVSFLPFSPREPEEPSALFLNIFQYDTSGLSEAKNPQHAAIMLDHYNAIENLELRKAVTELLITILPDDLPHIECMDKDYFIAKRLLFNIMNAINNYLPVYHQSIFYETFSKEAAVDLRIGRNGYDYHDYSGFTKPEIINFFKTGKI